MRNWSCRLALTGLLLIAGAAGAAADNYGAIAFSRATGAQGWSYDGPNRAATEGTAMANCRQYAGDCRVTTWFRNACGALAVGNGRGYGSGWATSRGGAEAIALRMCRDSTSGCAVVRWACTTR